MHLEPFDIQPAVAVGALEAVVVSVDVVVVFAAAAAAAVLYAVNH